MGEKKRTHIVVGFNDHTLSSVERSAPHMEKADVILLENSPERVRDLLHGKRRSHYPVLYKFPEFVEKQVPLLRRLNKEGRIILGSEMIYDSTWLNANREKAKKVLDLEEKEEECREKGDIKNYAKTDSELNKIREEERLKWIMAHLPEFEGKTIYIDVGTIHTPIYHRLKKELEPKGVSVKAEFLSKDMFKERGVMFKYHPFAKLVRTFHFNTPKSKSWKEIKRLVREDKKFDKRVIRAYKGYRSQNMTKEQAMEKAFFGVLTAEKKSIPARIKSSFKRKR